MEAMNRIMVIDDNAAARRAMETLLTFAGYGVACAADGREALDNLRRGELPAVILLDLSMPVMDGWQFRRRQQQDPALSVIPVILVSAEEGLEQIAACLGVAAHQPKPVDPAELLKTLRLLDRQGSPALLAG